MKTEKKLFACFIAGLLVMSFIGCTPTTGSNSAPAPDPISYPVVYTNSEANLTINGDGTFTYKYGASGYKWTYTGSLASDGTVTFTAKQNAYLSDDFFNIEDVVRQATISNNTATMTIVDFKESSITLTFSKQ